MRAGEAAVEVKVKVAGEEEGEGGHREEEEGEGWGGNEGGGHSMVEKRSNLEPMRGVFIERRTTTGGRGGPRMLRTERAFVVYWEGGRDGRIITIR